MNTISDFNRSPYYWLLMTFIGSAMEAVALYYQYALAYDPCVLCIHVRIWVMAFIFVGIIGFFIHKTPGGLKVSNLLSVAAAIGYLERCYQTLAVERGWNRDGACDMSAGLPSWFDLENWLPAIFQVKTPCGFTPYVFFEISMAEILIVVGILALIATLVLSVLSFRTDQ